MRVVGGKFRGRTLAAPKNDFTRPTSDRVRESIFNVLTHSDDCPALDGARIIDLFAGTGALAIEALSRGADYALLVETDASARAVIQRNIESFSLQGATRIFRRDATDLGPAKSTDRYNFAFLDPPYGKGLGEAALQALFEGGWLNEGAVAILEERTNVALEIPQGFEVFDSRTYGDTTVTFLKTVRPSTAIVDDA